MSDIPINLDRISKEDTYSIATALIYSLRKEPKYSVMSELFYILDHDNFVRMIQYFGGKEIRVPSSEEINDSLKIMLLYQFYDVEGLPWDLALQKSGFNQEETPSVKVKLTQLRKVLDRVEIGRKSYD